MDNRNTIILVTGGSGYIASWTICHLLKQGYTVRTTVRHLARESEVRSMIRKEVKDDGCLSFFEADLLNDKGWKEACEGVRFVLHMASPLKAQDKKKEDLVRSAREGTVRVLKYADQSKVERVVVTSSVGAAIPDHSVKEDYIDESTWTDLEQKCLTRYARSKTLAEQDAWEFIKHAKSGMSLATILPSLVEGPVLGKDYSESVKIMASLVRGEFPLIPRIGFSFIDVRDLAELHLKVLLHPEAAGERFIASSDFLWLIDIANLLKQHFGVNTSKVSTRIAPDWLIRIGSLLNSEMREVVPLLGQKLEFNSGKAEKLLQWKARPAKEAILDCAKSLFDQGLI